MKYNEFHNLIKEPFFRINDVVVKQSGISSVQLSRWHKAGYIEQIKRGLYSFKDSKEGLDHNVISFLLYEPSYISLESALREYNFIPEMVPNITSITTKTTRTFTNGDVTYFYKHIKPEFFFGYVPVVKENLKYLIAEPEKALLDYIYFHQDRFDIDGDMEEWRLDRIEVKESVDLAKLKKYAAVFQSSKMEKILNILIKYADL
ncbi:MAG: type IV toxin-antitoxin system AbiEi family antitoxin domain-containing protein [Candidatus Taylorbacteria bacterium]|nr:type IV toxin-antitoxin system AbiEi family antitoxin domain-containing protein [Candidatus Taylorbacteria bacterium]